jgi:hypothetical protein
MLRRDFLTSFVPALAARRRRRTGAIKPTPRTDAMPNAIEKAQLLAAYSEQDIRTALGGSSRFSFSPSSMTSGYIHHVQAKAGTNNWIVYQNGNSAQSTQTNTQNWSGGASPKHMFGASSDQANGSTQNQWFHGWLMELRIWNRVLSSSERNEVLAAWNSRYGLSYTSF